MVEGWGFTVVIMIHLHSYIYSHKLIVKILSTIIIDLPYFSMDNSSTNKFTQTLETIFIDQNWFKLHQGNILKITNCTKFML